MAREGVPLYRVSKYLGHADPWITENVYLHLYPSDAQEDAAKLSRPARAATRCLDLTESL
jgi:hypothetical protein